MGIKADAVQVSYQVQLSNGSLIRVDVFLVLSEPVVIQQDHDERQLPNIPAAGTSYQWTSVTRGQPTLV